MGFQQLTETLIFDKGGNRGFCLKRETRFSQKFPQTVKVDTRPFGTLKIAQIQGGLKGKGPQGKGPSQRYKTTVPEALFLPAWELKEPLTRGWLPEWLAPELPTWCCTRQSPPWRCWWNPSRTAPGSAAERCPAPGYNRAAWHSRSA